MRARTELPFVAAASASDVASRDFSAKEGLLFERVVILVEKVEEEVTSRLTTASESAKDDLFSEPAPTVKVFLENRSSKKSTLEPSVFTSISNAKRRSFTSVRASAKDEAMDFSTLTIGSGISTSTSRFSSSFMRILLLLIVDGRCFREFF